MDTFLKRPSGLLILVVEDEPAIGQVLHTLLAEQGYRPIGPAPTIAAAKQAIADHALDAALLDIRLGGDDRSFELAQILQAIHVPFAFVSSYTPALVPARFRDHPFLRKPFASAELFDVLEGLLGGPGNTMQGGSFDRHE
jgi:CheY-like chemotaxis protein